jgi:hypothetical protein
MLERAARLKNDPVKQRPNGPLNRANQRFLGLDQDYKGGTGSNRAAFFISLRRLPEMNTAKLKQIGFIAAVALGATLVMNTLAKKSSAVASLNDTVKNGL